MLFRSPWIINLGLCLEWIERFGWTRNGRGCGRKRIIASLRLINHLICLFYCLFTASRIWMRFTPDYFLSNWTSGESWKKPTLIRACFPGLIKLEMGEINWRQNCYLTQRVTFSVPRLSDGQQFVLFKFAVSL